MICKRLGHRSQVKVLVADWDQANAAALARILRTAGFQVATACDGKEAIAKADGFQPDLLIAEPYLGRLSGIEAASQITASLPDCKVLFLSGEASMAQIAKAAPSELVYSYTAKPIHPLDLLNAICYQACAEWAAGEPGSPVTNGSTEQGAARNRPHSGKPRAAEPESALGSRSCFPGALLQPALP